MISITTDRCRARELAQQAYILAYPMLENYKTMYIQAVNRKNAPSFNEFRHVKALVGPQFDEVVTVNNDTLYSNAWLDLRDEPVVLTVPAIDERYYTFQLIDMYTHNFGYVGTRTTGIEAGSYLIAGPDWSGDEPEGIIQTFKSEGFFVFNIGRTAVKGQDDLPNVGAIQEQYQLRTLSEFLNGGDETQSTTIVFPHYNQVAAESPTFIQYFNFLLGQLKPHSSEIELLEEFSEIGIGSGLCFDPNNYTPLVLEAIQEGICRALRKIKEKTEDESNQTNGWAVILNAFGDRTQMQGRYLQRAASAMAALYGNSDAEALYPIAYIDGDGDELDGRNHQYTLHFEADELPPVGDLGFWSLTLYDLESQQLVNNEIGRYSIGDRSDTQPNDDGSLTIYIQENEPSDAEYGQSNWLPTPPKQFEVENDEVVEYTGKFYLVLRLYLPQEEVLNEEWTPPGITKK